jgi:O-antigen/teichoic acid export membrane protein
LGGILVGPVNWAASALLVNQPRGYEEMAVYNAANQWFNILLFLPGVIGNVVLPMLSRSTGQKNKKDSKTTLKISLLANLIIVTPILIVGSIFSDKVMGLYGQDYEPYGSVLMITLFTAALLVINAPIGQLFAASSRMWTGLAMNSGWAAVYLIAAYFFTGLGALGLAASRCLAYALHTLWQYWYAKRYLFQREPNVY